eukprot:s818_g10.t1
MREVFSEQSRCFMSTLHADAPRIGGGAFAAPSDEFTDARPVCYNVECATDGSSYDLKVEDLSTNSALMLLGTCFFAGGSVSCADPAEVCSDLTSKHVSGSSETSMTSTTSTQGTGDSTTSSASTGSSSSTSGGGNPATTTTARTTSTFEEIAWNSGQDWPSDRLGKAKRALSDAHSALHCIFASFDLELNLKSGASDLYSRFGGHQENQRMVSTPNSAALNEVLRQMHEEKSRQQVEMERLKVEVKSQQARKPQQNTKQNPSSHRCAMGEREPAFQLHEEPPVRLQLREYQTAATAGGFLPGTKSRSLFGESPVPDRALPPLQGNLGDQLKSQLVELGNFVGSLQLRAENRSSEGDSRGTQNEPVSETAETAVSAGAGYPNSVNHQEDAEAMHPASPSSYQSPSSAGATEVEVLRLQTAALAQSLAGTASLTGLRGFFQVGDELWDAFVRQVGDPGEHIRVLAALPPTVLVQGCVSAVLPSGDSFSAMQATHVGLVWRTSRKLVHLWAGLPEAEFQDIDPWAPTPSQGPSREERPSSSGGQAQGQLKERVLKTSSLLDQGDDSELAPATREQVDMWLGVYVTIMGSVPQEEEELSEAQLAALHKRVFILKGSPYTDFALWTPFSRRNQRQQKFRVYQPLGDGSYLMRELPGPQNFQQWLTSWRVFKTAAIMLNIATLAVLLGYEKVVERLTTQWPRCWGLIAYSEDKARAERLDKIRRRFQQDKATGKIMPDDWTEDNPWNACFRALSQDDDYWNEQVRYPAAAWMASGGKGVPMAPAEQAAMVHAPGGGEVMDLENETRGDGRRRQANRDKRAAKARRIRSEREELESLRRRAHPVEGKSGGQDKGKGKGKSKDQAGTQICYSFASGTGVCGSVEPGGACLQKVKRAHKCQYCLSPGHRNADCPTKGG